MKPTISKIVDEYLKDLQSNSSLTIREYSKGNESLRSQIYRELKRRGQSSEKPKESKPTIEERYSSDRKERLLKSQLDEQKALYKKALSDLEISEKRFNMLINIKEKSDEYITPLIKDSEDHYCIPIIVYSDWHIEERVDSNTVNGLNEYTPEIAVRRLNKLFNSTAKLIVHLQSFCNIDTIYVSLNGDMITGYIHEDLRESNWLSPTQAVRLARQQIVAGLKFLDERLDLNKIIVQTNFGNHGRTTQDKRHNTAHQNSFEWMMYHDIKEEFESNPKFSFHVSQSLISYYNFIRDNRKFVLRTMHGDNVKFQGGIGGLTVPLNKLLYRLDQTIKADYTIIGHFHTLFEATKRCFVNGSVIGYNAYVHDLGIDYEPPRQGLLLLDMDDLEIRAKYSISCD